ncbi:MAG: FkbM family methyltransferase [Bryobacterales bacterium]|nr:FkbM family methyltransferase [Bryobacterales bacterium]
MWDKDDVNQLNVFENSTLDSFVMNTRQEVPGQKPRKVLLPLTTIDKMVGELGLTKVDYIKMDIEGAERQAIAGGAETIRRFRPRMSIATENLDDDYLKVPEAVRAVRADYKSTCLLCRDLSFLSARPDIVHFN